VATFFTATRTAMYNRLPECVTRCPGGQLFAYDEASGRYNGIQCSGVVV